MHIDVSYNMLKIIMHFPLVAFFKMTAKSKYTYMLLENLNIIFPRAQIHLYSQTLT